MELILKQRSFIPTGNDSAFFFSAVGPGEMTSPFPLLETLYAINNVEVCLYIDIFDFRTQSSP